MMPSFRLTRSLTRLTRFAVQGLGVGGKMVEERGDKVTYLCLCLYICFYVFMFILVLAFLQHVYIKSLPKPTDFSAYRNTFNGYEERCEKHIDT